MSTVGPYHNRQETYSYYSLPFCTGTKDVINHYHETLSEALQGIELKFSGLDIEFKGEYIYNQNLNMCNYLNNVIYIITQLAIYKIWICMWFLIYFRGYLKDRILPDKSKRRKPKGFCVCSKKSILVSNVH